MAVTNGWGQAAKNNTNGFGKLATNTINEGAIYENSWSGDTALIGTSAAFAYGKSSYNQGEADPTPTITGTAGGSFNADAGVVFVDTGSFNSSTGQIDLSATTIDNHIITYTVDGVQSGQSVGVESAPYSSTRSFSFDGVNDYFQIGENTDVITDFKQAWSVSWWAKWQGGQSSFAGFWQLGNINSGNVVQLAAHIDSGGSGGQISISHGYSSFPTIQRGFGSSLNDNQWHHYCVTGSGAAGNFIVYIDGSSSTQTGGSTAAGLSTDSNNNIGRIKFGASDRPLTGLMDEMSIWNTALSSDAITEIYNSGAPSELTSLTNASSSNLKAWYKMGE